MLFPIGLVALLILYFTERFSIAWLYRMPPNYDDDLNRGTMSAVLWYPVFYAGIGFWMFTNEQIFANFVYPIKYIGEHVTQGHYIANSVEFVKPGWPFLILLAIIVISRITHYSGLNKAFLSNEVKAILEGDKLESKSFYEIISNSDKKWLLAEEKYLYKNYGIRRLPKGVY